jgi:cell division protein FtsZ
MTINLKAPELRELKPRIMVCGVGGAGGNAVNNMIVSGLIGVDFIVANTDAQALTSSKADRIIQMGLQVTEGLGAGSKPEVGRAAAEEAIEEIRDHLAGAHMVFVTAGMGGGTGTGAAPVVARVAREMGILTVGVVTKPFQFEGARRMRVAEVGIEELQKSVDTLIIIPNQNLFRVANEKTTFADAFAMADQVLYSGVACITDLMVKEGLINLDFADVRSIMSEMGKAMMGTGEASGDRRAIQAAEAAIANPLLDEVSMGGARGLLISITGGNDLGLYEVDEAASRIRQEVDEDANIILGATFDSSLDGVVRVSVVATGIDQEKMEVVKEPAVSQHRIAEAAQRLRAQAHARLQAAPPPAPAPAPQPIAEIAVEPEHERTASLAASLPADVEIRPAAPKPAFYVEPPAQQTLFEEEPPAEFVPPQAEQIVRPIRMPQVEDLPPVVQRQMRQQRGEPQVPQPETRRKSLLEKLAAFGITKQEETEPPAPRAAPALPAPPAPRAAPPAQSHADYGRPQPRALAPRVAQGALDPHGRVGAKPSIEEDQLEIPAFLRRSM